MVSKVMKIPTAASLKFQIQDSGRRPCKPRRATIEHRNAITDKAVRANNFRNFLGISLSSPNSIYSLNRKSTPFLADFLCLRFESGVYLEKCATHEILR